MSKETETETREITREEALLKIQQDFKQAEENATKMFADLIANFEATTGFTVEPTLTITVSGQNFGFRIVPKATK